MIDIKAFKNEHGQFSVQFADGDFKKEDGFDTAIYLILLSDQRAPNDKIAVPENRRGWLGDTVSPENGRLFGSLLWLLDQSRLNQDTLNTAVNYAQLALNQLVVDGLAKSLKVTGEIIPRTGIQLKIIITSQFGKVTTHYVRLWELTGNAN